MNDRTKKETPYKEVNIVGPADEGEGEEEEDK